MCRNIGTNTAEISADIRTNSITVPKTSHFGTVHVRDGFPERFPPGRPASSAGTWAQFAHRELGQLGHFNNLQGMECSHHKQNKCLTKVSQSYVYSLVVRRWAGRLGGG